MVSVKALDELTHLVLDVGPRAGARCRRGAADQQRALQAEEPRKKHQPGPHTIAGGCCRTDRVGIASVI